MNAPCNQIAAGERALRFALAGAATWRLTHLIALEDGPADAIVKLRVRAGSSQLGELMDCFDCLSIWVAAGFAPFVARRPGERVVGWLALSGVACALQQIVGAGEHEQQPALVVEEGDARDELLRP